MKLKHNFSFSDLYNISSLQKLDQIFIEFLQEINPDAGTKLLALRQNQAAYIDKDISNILIEVAKVLEVFIGDFFCIEEQVEELSLSHKQYKNLALCKKQFVQRIALSKYKTREIDFLEVKSELEKISSLDEIILASNILSWMEEKNEERIEIAALYSVYMASNPPKNSILFKLPQKLDYDNLVNLEEENLVVRTNFSLSDKGCDLKYAIDQTSYCIFCHNQGKDSCSKGYREKGGEYSTSSLSVKLYGCPLEEKISEMNILKDQGFSIGSVAMVLVDNPMPLATGSRICNDCMKSCIYQKQDPVNIPEIETRSLKDVLFLPWGFEIYSLLTRWNPLKIKGFLPYSTTGYKVLIVGQGPAGFTLAHYLLNEGHKVVAIDGLKIEKLEQKYLEPIYDVGEILEDLDTRTKRGFGGVMEYGITVRWNKNFLKLIHILLARRENYSLFSGIRFGSNITEEDAFNMGFDHIALCLGAGKPNLPNIKNILPKGVRTASDFLMSLQLGDLQKYDANSSLQIRLPIIVIGGGLTAIDTATESLLYYQVQIRKILEKYEKGEINEAILSAQEKEILNEFLLHAREIRDSTENPIKILQKYGGVKILYRRSLQESPAYRLNHEEVTHALREGIKFIPNINPLEFIVENDYLTRIRCSFNDEAEIEFPARTALIAAGTAPNTILDEENPDIYKMNGKYFVLLNEEGNEVEGEVANPKTTHPHFLTSDKISFFGDLHPSYFGNVVKAMASAKNGYKFITKELQKNPPSSKVINESLFITKVLKVNELAPGIIEVILNSPLAAVKFKPGQFFKLQNFGSDNIMEPLALTGASFDKEKGLISLIALEIGKSSKLCRHLRIGEEVILMGPTGEPTLITKNENILLIGGGLGNAVLFSIGQAFKVQGSRVTYFAGYRKYCDRYKIEEIEKASDKIIWCCDEEKLEISRAGDESFKGNMVEALFEYKEFLKDIDRIICIGSDKMMQAVRKARETILKPYLKTQHIAIASINSPMQCMMKGICAQCLQKHIDPITREESFVYSCVNQDQNMDTVDFKFLSDRLGQNSLMEKI